MLLVDCVYLFIYTMNINWFKLVIDEIRNMTYKTTKLKLRYSIKAKVNSGWISCIELNVIILNNIVNVYSGWISCIQLNAMTLNNIIVAWLKHLYYKFTSFNFLEISSKFLYENTNFLVILTQDLHYQ